MYKRQTHELVKVDGGLLVQQSDRKLADEYKVVTEKAPTAEQLKDMEFGMKVVKYVKSCLLYTSRCV